MEVHVPQGERALSGVVSGIVRHFHPMLYVFTMATYGYTDILIDNRLLCEQETQLRLGWPTVLFRQAIYTFLGQ